MEAVQRGVDMLTAANKRRRTEKERIREISEQLRQVSEALEVSDAGFNEVSDDDLLEAIIFERSSLRARYSFLLKELRKINGA